MFQLRYQLWGSMRLYYISYIRLKKMNTRLLLPALIAVSLFLTGCPLSSSYPLGYKADAKPFNSNLIGTWSNKPVKEEDGHEVAKVVISKGNSANSYRVTVKEKRESFAADTEVFEGWITELNGMQFFVLQEIIKGSPTQSYYVYHFSMLKESFTTNDISLKVKGTDAITSVEAYQEEVKASMNHKEFHSEKTVWMKL